MADVSKVKINNTEYDIKDETARTNLATKAPLASPALTGTPTAPTATSGTSTTQIATTAFAKGEADKKVSNSGGTMTGVLYMTPLGSGNEGGQIDLNAPASNMTDNGISVDQKSGDFRIFGVASRDGTTKTGTGTVFSLNPYDATFGSGYTFKGSLEDSGWKSLTDNTKFSGTIYYRKIGKMVEVTTYQLTLASTLSSNSVTLATLPSGYRPSKNTMVFIGIDSSYNGTLMIYANGQILLSKNTHDTSISTSQNIYFQASYFID